MLFCRDHRKLVVGDSNGRVYPWTVSESVGQCVCVCVCYLHVGGVPCCITFNAMCVYSMHVL